MPSSSADTADLRAQVASNQVWYHTIALPGGVVTPGQVDLRTSAPKLLPADLSGLRALDVGTFDGFWAFELERRGAQTVAIDVEQLDHAQWPPLNRPRLLKQAADWNMQLGKGFAIAHQALGSSVERVITDVYDVTPDRIGGPVDVVFAGAIMVHLRDPVRALEALLGCLKPGGTLIQMEHFSIRNTIKAPRRPTGDFQPLRSDFNWWFANLSLLKAWPWAAGFQDVERTGFMRPPSSSPMTGWYVGLKSRRPQ
jgi:SAM-dependent methyltransferase